jgi:nucleotide-binding universal stress UspA family protein
MFQNASLRCVGEIAFAVNAIVFYLFNARRLSGSVLKREGLLGNTAERLLSEISCSVLAVKPADFTSLITVSQ